MQPVNGSYKDSRLASFPLFFCTPNFVSFAYQKLMAGVVITTVNSEANA